MFYLLASVTEFSAVQNPDDGGEEGVVGQGFDALPGDDRLMSADGARGGQAVLRDVVVQADFTEGMKTRQDLRSFVALTTDGATEHLLLWDGEAEGERVDGTLPPGSGYLENTAMIFLSIYLFIHSTKHMHT